MDQLMTMLLNIRSDLRTLSQKAEGFGYLDKLPEIGAMQRLEVKAFNRINKWASADVREDSRKKF